MPLATPSGGLEELVDEASGKEIVATPVVMNRLDSLMRKYEDFLGLGYGEIEWAQNHVQEVVLPCEINIFLQSTLHYESHKNYIFTGFFISQLVQNSYHAGNNEFELDMSPLKSIDNLVSKLSGTEERIVRVVITGRVGSWCGAGARYSTFTIQKAENNCGSGAKNSTFIIEKAGDWCGFQADYSTFTIGKTGDWCGTNVHHSIFTIERAGNGCGQSVQYSTFTIEKAGKWCGQYAKHSTLTIEEAGIECGDSVKSSTFKTHNPKQYERFKESVPQNEENTLYLLSSDNSVLKGGSW